MQKMSETWMCVCYYTGGCTIIFLSSEMEEVVLKSPLSELHYPVSRPCRNATGKTRVLAVI